MAGAGPTHRASSTRARKPKGCIVICARQPVHGALLLLKYDMPESTSVYVSYGAIRLRTVVPDWNGEEIHCIGS